MQLPDEDSPDPIQIARSIGEARRDAHSALDELATTPWPEKNVLFYKRATAGLEVALRELLEAIAAAATHPGGRTTEVTLTEDQKAAAITAGVPPDVFSDEAEQGRADWLTWSAIRLAQERDDLAHLSELTAFDIVPGLSDVVAAFASDVADLERFHILRAPMEELGGVSPLRWLLTGGDPQLLVTLIDDLGYDG